MMSTVAFGGALAKRFAEQEPPNFKLPSFFYWISFVDLLLFLPVFIILAYTFGNIYPTLAAVEDPLSGYEALPMNDDDTPKDNSNPVPTAQPGKPVTASLRATNRLLRSLGGWFSNFRGLGYAFLISIMMFVCLAVVGAFPFLGVTGGLLVAFLGLSPLQTAWTHVVITPPSTKTFFSRVPPLRKTYVATWLPTVFLWAAAQLSMRIPAMLAKAIGLSLTEPGAPGRFRDTPPTGAEAAKGLCVAGVALGLQALLAIPAHTALTRVQASLLPADEDTIVPFDRSFGGRVEPEVVTGKGFATLGAALKSVSRASWLRIYLQRVKLFAVNVAVQVLFAVVVMLQVLIVRQACDNGDGSGGLKCY